MDKRIAAYFKNLAFTSVPQLSVNCVIFGFYAKQLHVVVNKLCAGKRTIHLLPGGFVGQEEDVADAVQRIVRESTGLEKILFKQFAVFGDADRSFPNEINQFLKSFGSDAGTASAWFSKRFVSICYMALVDFQRIELKPTQFLDAAQWLPVTKAKTLAMDHGKIAKAAHESLKKELPYAPLASNLLPARFTLPELHSLVEAILERPVDRPNFRRKVLKSGMLIKVGQDKSGRRRPADLYAFRHGRRTSLIDEFRFGF